MTTLFRPVPITSAEQAEALPVGTIAIEADHQDLAEATNYGPGRPMVRCRHWEPTYAWHSDWNGAEGHEAVVGWTALVPIEAEQETMRRPSTPLGDAIRRSIGHESNGLRRLVTRWGSIR